MAEEEGSPGDVDELLDAEPFDEFEQGTEFGAAGDVEFPPKFSAEESPQKKGGVFRLLFALLLIVAVVGAGFYLLGQTLYTASTVATPSVAQKTIKLKVPARPNPVGLSEGVQVEVVPADKVVVVGGIPVVSQPKKNQPVAKVVPVAKPAFRLESPKYIYAGEVTRVIRRIKKLGYEIERTSTPETHEMTRLLVGIYSKPVALKKLAELKNKVAGAFLVAEQGKYAIYAGSYVSLDKARREADLLFQKGVRSDEKHVKVALSRTILHFGRFATRQEARKSVDQLKKMGIKDVSIVAF